ncbi:unnamed protein product, partial [Nesidiocoris tenuis]
MMKSWNDNTYGKGEGDKRSAYVHTSSHGNEYRSRESDYPAAGTARTRQSLRII